LLTDRSDNAVCSAASWQVLWLQLPAAINDFLF
jgi:hypothetical protein